MLIDIIKDSYGRIKVPNKLLDELGLEHIHSTTSFSESWAIPIASRADVIPKMLEMLNITNLQDIQGIMLAKNVP